MALTRRIAFALSTPSLLAIVACSSNPCPAPTPPCAPPCAPAYTPAPPTWPAPTAYAPAHVPTSITAATPSPIAQPPAPLPTTLRTSSSPPPAAVAAAPRVGPVANTTPVAPRSATSTAAPAPAPSVGGPVDYDAILRKYVKGDYLDYAALRANATDLARFRAFLKWQGTADPKSMSREDAIAFWINAYNSTNIAMVLDSYPVHSPMDIPGYFDKIKHRVAGEDLTVSEIEYERLIATYQDMRAHFAVVCSDRGCLPLRAEAWKGATLDADLDAAARKFVADPRHFKVDFDKKEVWISKIFEWYGEKFTKDPVRPAAKPELFLLPYVDARTRALLESGDYTLKIIEWNWTLNEKHGA